MRGEDLRLLLLDLATTGQIASIVVSSPADRGSESCRKIVGRPVSIRDSAMIQFERFCGTKTTHANLSPVETANEVVRLLERDFRQAHVRTVDEEVHIRRDGAGAFVVSRKRHAAPVAIELRTHDRQKAHPIREGDPVPFLCKLGVMTEDGRVIASQRDKFRQVNRFLEIVADSAFGLDSAAPLRIVDFGCGKAYLTFAVHHYFMELRGLAVEVVGVDRRADVIETCRRVADEIGAEGLRFEVGSIESGASLDAADVVIALHACDTATDDALARAVSMGAKLILAAPCCQHELDRQLENRAVAAMLKHGIVRERLTGLVTDSLRAALLETRGYKVTLIEFIDPVHTPKNILLRAELGRMPEVRRTSAMQDYETLRDFWHASPKLERLLSPGSPKTGIERASEWAPI